MSDQKPLLPAIAPASGGALTTATGPQRIATRMAENLLGVARSQERALAAQKRYRIGDYEFREADHAQIQRWARMLEMTPEQVVEVLASSQKKSPYDTNRVDTNFHVRDGSIVSLVWDFDLFPLTDWAWVDDLRIDRIAIVKSLNGYLPRLPPSIRNLVCYRSDLIALDLSATPKLTRLSCGGNQLTHLDLAHVPSLARLYCWNNQLSELDLSPVSRLRELSCADNPLKNLNLAPVPGLVSLNRGKNQLPHLDLTHIPKLEQLFCSDNELMHLDLTAVPRLQELWCDRNPLTALDLTSVPELQDLWCDASLNITGAPLNLGVNRI